MMAAKNPIICPHCGRPIARPGRPRDLGLLLHALTYRVPVEQEVGEEWIQVAARHCKMKPERLAQLRAEPYARFWNYMQDKRARRLEWFKGTGQVPPFGWYPPHDGERDYSKGIEALKRYRKTVARVKAQFRKHGATQRQKIANQYLQAKRIRCHNKKIEAINDLEARLIMASLVESGELTLGIYDALTAMMQPKPAKRRHKGGQGIDSRRETSTETGREERTTAGSA